MLGEQATESLLRLLTSTAAHTVPASVGSGITLMDPSGTPTTSAASDAVVTAVDAEQYALQEGPCLTAWQERRAVRVDDVANDPRWPRWGERAAELGVRACLSAALVVGDECLGALKVYADGPGAFTERDEATVALFAAQSAILVQSSRTFRRAGELSEELVAMLEERDLLNRAIGIVMARDHAPPEAAFGYLVSLAQRDRRPVHETAARLVAGYGRKR